MGIETVIIASIITSTLASVATGAIQMQQQRKNIKSAEKQQEYNIEKERRNQQLIEKQRTDTLSDKSRMDRLETGAYEAQQGAMGLSMNVGTPLNLAIGNEIAQQLDSNRLNDRFNNSALQEKMALNSANLALDQQIDKNKSAMWSTGTKMVVDIAGGVAQVAGVPSGASAPSGEGIMGTSNDLGFTSSIVDQGRGTGAYTWDKFGVQKNPSVFNTPAQ